VGGTIDPSGSYGLHAGELFAYYIGYGLNGGMRYAIRDILPVETWCHGLRFMVMVG